VRTTPDHELIAGEAVVRGATTTTRRSDAPRHRAVVESMAVPWLLLATTVLASVRVTDGSRLVFAPPSLMALMLGVLFVGLVVQSGVVRLASLVGERRSPLENTTGIVDLVLLLVASAQVFSMLIPERGLFSFVVATYFLLLLLSTLAARPEADRVLRSLAVTLGGALLLKFVVLSGLSAPGGSLAKRLFAITLDGITLGALGATPQPIAAGYLAFAAVLLLFIALWIVPRQPA